MSLVSGASKLQLTYTQLDRSVIAIVQRRIADVSERCRALQVCSQRRAHLVCLLTGQADLLQRLQRGIVRSRLARPFLRTSVALLEFFHRSAKQSRVSASVCKIKTHKRCAIKVELSCKWTTLQAIPQDAIIVDDDGVTLMDV